MATSKDKTLSVAELSAMVEKEDLGWVPGETTLTALPASEQDKYLGVKVTKAEMKAMAAETKALAEKEVRAFEFRAPVAAPAAWDWRNVGGKNYVTSVKDQGGCGSCVSFGTCATIEAMIRIKSNDHTMAVDLSEAFMQFCGGGSCSGWGLTSGLAYAKSTGVTDEACFPYQPRNMPCSDRCSDWESRLTKILSYTGHSTTEARKNAISGIGPVVGGLAVYSDFYAYSSGVYRRTSASTLRGYHCISVVGYDDSRQAWLIKNSWGPGWGDGGFCYIGYGQSELLIDSDWAFYSADPDVKPKKACGIAKHIAVQKVFGGGVVLWAYVDAAWRHRIVGDAELIGIAQDLFAADSVVVCYDGNNITMVRAQKTP
jgi:C1A family cysteine protease